MRLQRQTDALMLGDRGQRWLRPGLLLLVALILGFGARPAVAAHHANGAVAALSEQTTACDASATTPLVPAAQQDLSSPAGSSHHGGHAASVHHVHDVAVCPPGCPCCPGGKCGNCVCGSLAGFAAIPLGLIRIAAVGDGNPDKPRQVPDICRLPHAITAWPPSPRDPPSV